MHRRQIGVAAILILAYSPAHSPITSPALPRAFPLGADGEARLGGTIAATPWQYFLAPHGAESLRFDGTRTIDRARHGLVFLDSNHRVARVILSFPAESTVAAARTSYEARFGPGRTVPGPSGSPCQRWEDQVTVLTLCAPDAICDAKHR